MKQLHVLVLGLDVLGNPFGVIRGVAEGVESFFYEPYKVNRTIPFEQIETFSLLRERSKVRWNLLKVLQRV